MRSVIRLESDRLAIVGGVASVVGADAGDLLVLGFQERDLVPQLLDLKLVLLVEFFPAVDQFFNRFFGF